MLNDRPIRLVAALFNISLYFYIFLNDLPKGENSRRKGKLTVNSTNPLSISAPQSIVQSKIHIAIWRDFCPHAVVRVMLVGPEICVFPPFTLDSDQSSQNVFSLEVDIQKSYLLLGVYTVEVTLMRCHDEGKTKAAAIGNATTISCSVEAEWNNILNIRSPEYGSKWVWVYSPKCNSGQRSPECAQPGGSHPNQQDYIFMEIDRETKSPVHNNLVTLKDGGTVISKPVSLRTSDDNSSLLKFFNELSNYELVCWLGGDDAQRLWRAFMDLFPRLGSGQRPFKFKYLKLTDTNAKDFSEASHMTYNKCKILFVSYGIDRFDSGISPEAYGQEVSALIAHMEKSHSDRTYPVWFLSSTSIPDKTTSCVEDAGFQGRSPYRIHAFNEEVRRIFSDRQLKLGTPQSESHIHLMDNTDITEVLEGTLSNQHAMESQITSTVAMRCMEKIAHQVQAWRSMNQIGTQHGLMRNGTLIPNDELYKQPYKWGK